jgi:hypothetical protein
VPKKQDSWELRRIKEWYDRIEGGCNPSQQELEIQFDVYADQAELLVQRIVDGQPWEDFILGIDGAPAGLLSRLSNNSGRFYAQGGHVSIIRSRKW